MMMWFAVLLSYEKKEQTHMYEVGEGRTLFTNWLSLKVLLWLPGEDIDGTPPLYDQFKRKSQDENEQVIPKARQKRGKSHRGSEW